MRLAQEDILPRVQPVILSSPQAKLNTKEQAVLPFRITKQQDPPCSWEHESPVDIELECWNCCFATGLHFDIRQVLAF